MGRNGVSRVGITIIYLLTQRATRAIRAATVMFGMVLNFGNAIMIPGRRIPI